MAFPIFVPDHLVVLPPPDHIASNLVKHLIIRGQTFQSFSFKPIQESNILQYLRRLKGAEVIDLIIVVNFGPNNNPNEEGLAMDVMRRGICFEGSCFRFLGHSDEQLQHKTCFLMHDSELAIYEFFEKFADFSSVPSVSKRSECIGNLFSGFVTDNQVTLKENDYFVIEDIKEGKYNFSYGCGYMSMQFATEIKQLVQLDFLPCVVKVVYQGFSGLLLVRTDMNLVKVEFRESMKKFVFAHGDVFNSLTTVNVLDYSRPHSNGYLGANEVMLLADGGVSREYLIQLQGEYYSLLDNLCTSKTRAVYYLQATGNDELLNKLNSEGMDTIKEELKQLKEQELEKMTASENHVGNNSQTNSCDNIKYNVRVLIPKSRIAYGVCDPYNKLEYGECYFNPTLSKEEEQDFAEVDKVVVIRKSSYYPGDMRVLKVQRKHSEYNPYKDCIVFPVKGARPHSLECGGIGEDKFFLAWDTNLIPRWKTPPYSYGPNMMGHVGGRLYEQSFQFMLQERAKDCLYSVIGYPENYTRQMKLRQRQELAGYFASYDANLLQKFGGIYMKYASARGPSSKECRRLHHVFFRTLNDVGGGIELEKTMAQYEDDYKNLLRPESKARRCFLINILISNGLMKPYFELGDDIWNIMEKSVQVYLKQLEENHNKSDSPITADSVVGDEEIELVKTNSSVDKKAEP